MMVEMSVQITLALYINPSVEIGKQNNLKHYRLAPWRFESSLGYFIYINILYNNIIYCLLYNIIYINLFFIEKGYSLFIY
jgi:hypothetical protein